MKFIPLFGCKVSNVLISIISSIQVTSRAWASCEYSSKLYYFCSESLFKALSRIGMRAMNL